MTYEEVYLSNTFGAIGIEFMSMCLEMIRIENWSIRHTDRILETTSS